ncbi:MAG: cryptochrome/photolyase family protein [Gemmatimonadaceae bacterium]|nr:cryptochrome/photolyase family protein [Gemmatimonadaceae bacterium]
MPGPNLVFVAPWECSRLVAQLPRAPQDGLVAVFIESVDKGASLPWHRHKLVLVLSAMAHFAEQLREAGYAVHQRLAESYDDGLVAAAQELGASRVIATEGREQDMVDALERARPRLAALGVPLELREDRGFLCARADFEDWARGRKELRMELFYRTMRRRLGVLMEPDGEPTGGAWNFDAENRKRWPGDKPVPEPFRVEPDAMTRAIMARVARWRDRWGTVDGFRLPVTRADALAILDRFITERLPDFGPYEDAMVDGEPDLAHSTLSAALNIGLLHPRELVERAERAYRERQVTLPSAEGFIRQVMGWREYVRGMYWHGMPAFREANALECTRPLPMWYWAPDGEAYGEGPTAPCGMRCLADSVRQVRDTGRVHHIARLMVQSNFATLLGVVPAALNRWFWAGFVDGYEWVTLPNVNGMSTWGDGGRMTSKPYVSTGAYIDRMSDYCGKCRYDVKRRTGESACPFNVLYWDFLAQHRERFARHPRMAMMIRNLDRIPAAELRTIRKQATAFRASLVYDGSAPIVAPAPNAGVRALPVITDPGPPRRPRTTRTPATRVDGGAAGGDAVPAKTRTAGRVGTRTVTGTAGRDGTRRTAKPREDER